jgi:hypothetical protein
MLFAEGSCAAHNRQHGSLQACSLLHGAQQLRLRQAHWKCNEHLRVGQRRTRKTEVGVGVTGPPVQRPQVEHVVVIKPDALYCGHACAQRRDRRTRERAGLGQHISRRPPRALAVARSRRRRTRQVRTTAASEQTPALSCIRKTQRPCIGKADARTVQHCSAQPRTPGQHSAAAPHDTPCNARARRRKAPTARDTSGACARARLQKARHARDRCCGFATRAGCSA